MSGFTDVLRARILIVDDQLSNLRLLEHVLRRAGYVAVSITANPLEVCDLHRQNHFDLILLDLQMPRMNGFAVMEGLKCIDDKHGVAVLVLTADPAQMVRALEAGARSFLSKPFVLTEVLDRVRIMLEKTLSRETEEPVTPLETPATFPIARDPLSADGEPQRRAR